jgi:putative membrane protein
MGPIETILIVGIVIACTAWYMRHLWRKRARRIVLRDSMALELLARRYARGEIGRDEYILKKNDIMGYLAAAQSVTNVTPP